MDVLKTKARQARLNNTTICVRASQNEIQSLQQSDDCLDFGRCRCVIVCPRTTPGELCTSIRIELQTHEKSITCCLFRFFDPAMLLI